MEWSERSAEQLMRRISANRATLKGSPVKSCRFVLPQKYDDRSKSRRSPRFVRLRLACAHMRHVELPQGCSVMQACSGMCRARPRWTVSASGWFVPDCGKPAGPWPARPPTPYFYRQEAVFLKIYLPQQGGFRHRSPSRRLELARPSFAPAILARSAPLRSYTPLRSLRLRSALR